MPSRTQRADRPLRPVEVAANGRESHRGGVLLEVLKDMFYQCFVREGKLTRAIKVRRFFVEDGDLASTA